MSSLSNDKKQVGSVLEHHHKPALKLEPALKKILELNYPRFSAPEMARRRALMAAAMEKAGVDHLVVYAASFRGGPVHWLCDWLATNEAVLVFTPHEQDTLFVQFYNHLPQARQSLPDMDVRWGGVSTIQSVLDELVRRRAQASRIGAVGFLPMHYYKALAAKFGEVPDLDRDYLRLRLVKSREEVDWCRIGARLSDLSIAALRRELRPGLDERDLGAITEAAYLPWRGVNVIHYFSSTSMRDPDAFVPRQHPTARQIANGDAIACEISATFWGHGGQVLRTFSLGEPFTPLYRKLHDTAAAAYDAMFKLVRAGCNARELYVGAQIIEDAGFTFYDDLVHGYGGGYLPPIIGSPTRAREAPPDMVLEAGMLLVIQPNVITKDQKAGVQTGEMVLVTEQGAERLHTAPRGPFHIGA